MNKHMKNTVCLILAGGKGTRMKSGVPKPLHELGGKPMLAQLIDTVRKAGVKEIFVVLGHGAERVKAACAGARVIVQARQLGSGDAVSCARGKLGSRRGTLLLLYVDTPLLKAETLKKLLRAGRKDKAACAVLTVDMKNPAGYGRIVTSPEGGVEAIVEEKDATFAQKSIREINVGAYAFDMKALFKNLSRVRMNSKKKEYYLTDVIKIMADAGLKVSAVKTGDTAESMGINSREQLSEANAALKARVISELASKGVTVIDPATTFIEPGARLGKDTVIYPNTVIEHGVAAGRGCKIGPFARLRPGTKLGSNVEIGNFCELVRTRVGDGCKVKHMTYLGDAVLGKGINVGAGTITANYDGKNKHSTIIGDGAFIGVGSILIAPVKIGKRATVGAGSVVPKRHDIPSGATVMGVPARLYRGGRG